MSDRPKRRPPTIFEVYRISPTEEVVVRVRDYAGYPPAPQLEGKITKEPSDD